MLLTFIKEKKFDYLFKFLIMGDFGVENHVCQ